MLKKQFLATLLLLGTMGFAQTIPASNGQPYAVSGGTTTTTTINSPCSMCTPAGWLSGGGTPDISNATQAASSTNGTTAGGGALWTANETAGSSGTTITLPTPPNGHTRWLSLRDVGTVGSEESIYTTLSGLTIGREYEVVVYALTSTTRSNGTSSQYYAAKYIDKFTYEVVGTTPVVDVDMTVELRKEWVAKKLRFKATATSHTLYIRPGDDEINVTSHTKFETIQLSVTLNAINTVPVAGDDTATTAAGTPVTINVLTNDNEYDAGQSLVEGSIDLDPSTPGIQTTITTAQGTWTVSGGVVTFTPAPGFVGTATLSYTVQDDYTVSGSNPVTSAPATSLPATISITVEDPCNAGTTQVPLTGNTLSN